MTGKRQTQHAVRSRPLLGLARRWGCSVAEVGLSLGLVPPVLYARAYAQWHGVPYLDTSRKVEITEEQAVAAARHRLILVDAGGTVSALLPARDEGRSQPGVDRLVYTSTEEFDGLLRQHWRAVIAQTTGRLAAEAPRFSAVYRRNGPQLVWFGIVALVAILGVLPWYVWPAAAANAVLCLAFLAIAALRLLALPRPRYRHAASLPDHALPTYTVLVPLYRESAVLPQLVQGLCALNYPAAKLDIRLLLEEDDEDTLAALAAIALPPFITRVDIAPMKPRTKPKALNVGMIGARGSLVTIFDAEDIPDRDQLRKAAAHFAAAGPGTACVQARLRIDNGGVNPLTALFAMEYEALFRRILPCLERLRLPLPLGGTSNHVRRSALDHVGGWDAHNVTEDADLGMRLIRFGYRTETLDSDTWEEAPATVSAWLAQRCRWYKGWLQTWIVHMRSPAALWHQAGWRGFLGLQLLMGGMFLAAIAHPILVLTCVFWFAGVAGAPMGTDWMAVVNGASIAVGHGAMLALTWVACAEGPQARRRWWLAPVLPFYMILHAVAAIQAVIQYLHKPFHWSKTMHGRTSRGPAERI